MRNTVAMENAHTESISADTFISVADAAARLSVADQTVRRWLKSGIIRKYQRLPGGQFRIPVSELERILQPIEVSEGSEPNELSPVGDAGGLGVEHGK